MYVLLVFSAALFLTQLQYMHGLHKCDKNVISKISDLWKKDGTPKNLLKQAAAAGKQNVILTTDDYYPDGTTCSYTVLGKDGKSLTLIKKTKGAKNEEHEDLIEDDGVVTEKGTGIKRYHVYSKDGIAAWYKCGNGEDAKEGTPEGAIKVKTGSDYDKDDVKTAKEKLEKIGLELEDSYPSNCS